MSDRSFLNIAHRGASGYGPENTIPAFKKAVEMDIKNLECDVRLTRDDQVVVIHDATVDRTTGGKGKVREMTLSQLKQLDAGSWFSEEFAGVRIPELEEVLELLGPEIKLVIEIKGGDKNPEIIKNVIELVKEKGLISNIRISSFNLSDLEKVFLVNNNIVTSFLFRKTNLQEDLDKIKNAKVDILCPYYKNITSRMVEKIHSRGYLIRAWGLKNEEEETMEYLINCGIDGMTTNYPDVLKKVYSRIMY